MTSRQVPARASTHQFGARGALAAVLALLAVVALLGLTSVPHSHSGSSEERSCPACQVTRSDGAGLPGFVAARVVPPAGSPAKDRFVRPETTGFRHVASLLPPRGPPAASPAEQL